MPNKGSIKPEEQVSESTKCVILYKVMLFKQALQFTKGEIVALSTFRPAPRPLFVIFSQRCDE